MASYMVKGNSLEETERRELREKIKQLNEIASQNWDDPKWRKEMAKEIAETIYEGFEHENLIGLLAEVENLPFEGRSFVKEVRGLRAFWMARGGYIEESTLTSDVMEIPRDQIGFHVSEFEDKLRTNFAETQATLVERGTERMDAEINLRMLKLFQAAIPSTSPYYISGAGLSLTALNTAIREVKDATNGAGPVAIVGRATMTDQIVDALVALGGAGTSYAAFLPQTNEDLLRRGVVGSYRGVNVVTLNNYTDDQGISFFPANELYVVSRDASKFAFWAGLLVKEFEEEDNWYWHYLARRDFGGIVHRPDRLRRIIDTNTTP